MAITQPERQYTCYAIPSHVRMARLSRPVIADYIYTEMVYLPGDSRPSRLFIVSVLREENIT